MTFVSFLSQINSKSSYALCHLVPKARRVSTLSPLQLLKAVKNNTEAQGMRNSHVSDTHVYIHSHTVTHTHTHTITLSHYHIRNQIRDAAALCEYLQWLEEEVACVCMDVREMGEGLDVFMCPLCSIMLSQSMHSLCTSSWTQVLCVLVVMTGPPGSQRRAHRNISCRQTGRTSKVSYFSFPLPSSHKIITLTHLLHLLPLTPPSPPPSHISSTSSLSLLHHLPLTPPSPPPSHTSSSSLSHLHHLLPYTPPPPRVQPDYVSLSFPTISSSGPNGAIIHYKCVREGVCVRERMCTVRG